MDWWTVLKIKTSEGSFLRLEDFDAFVLKLRTVVRPFAARYFGDRRTYLRVNEYEQGDRLILNFTLRDPKMSERIGYDFTFIEEDGDYVFLTAIGPHLNLGTNDVVNSEYELLRETVTAVQTGILMNLEPSGKIPPKTEGKTAEQYKREVEEVNPGYVWDEKKNGLVKMTPQEIAREVARTLTDVMARAGIDR
jgi:hypothetical protein